jgi:hypothetical protein
MSKGSEDVGGGRRARSARYPGVALGEALAFCRQVDAKGHDGQAAPALAAALGHANVRTNTFSARLSAARQFGLMTLDGERYRLTPLAKSLLHPVDPDGVPALLRRALAEPPLYGAILARLANRPVPDAATLANLLYHDERITSGAKDHAAEAFLASARFAGVLAEDGLLRPDGAPASAPAPAKASTARPQPDADAPARRASRPAARSPVRIDLPLWGDDEGKTIKVRAPESMTRASLDRFLAALRLHVRIEGE